MMRCARCLAPLASASLLTGLRGAAGFAVSHCRSTSRLLGAGARGAATTSDDWVGTALILKTARLAQLEVSDAEAEQLVPRVRSFLGFVAAMDEAGAADGDAPPMGDSREGLGEGGFLRSDGAVKFENADAIAANMPLREGEYLRVPKVGAEEP
ncbi:C subunit of glutamyl-tRNA and/or aspartyl-tRNA amidotransferase [Tribonema minus]|uniref:C subunit of glutamyl-tRNA and/or aspartyl-tRNA amidotransferase n=1 Tax=Tribonema minus TaxID=303371 RepID=A0A836CJS8_9STRA|nr:C subunit of glutamyl-tRNA and/or aspartyl-tRNA amidotransferase [Tribonema minus]